MKEREDGWRRRSRESEATDGGRTGSTLPTDAVPGRRCRSTVQKKPGGERGREGGREADNEGGRRGGRQARRVDARHAVCLALSHNASWQRCRLI